MGSSVARPGSVLAINAECSGLKIAAKQDAARSHSLHEDGGDTHFTFGRKKRQPQTQYFPGLA